MIKYKTVDLEKNAFNELKTKYQHQLKFVVMIGLTAFVSHTLVLYIIALNVQQNIISVIQKSFQ